MSGGVDSSVAAYLIKEQGFEATGITLKLFDNEDIGEKKENQVKRARTYCTLRQKPLTLQNGIARSSDKTTHVRRAAKDRE